MARITKSFLCPNGYRPLAEAVGVRVQAVHKWVKAGRVPAERVLSVEAATGISRHELRPDVFGEAPKHSQEAA